jgi:hypothetical protein
MLSCANEYAPAQLDVILALVTVVSLVFGLAEGVLLGLILGIFQDAFFNEMFFFSSIIYGGVALSTVWLRHARLEVSNWTLFFAVLQGYCVKYVLVALLFGISRGYPWFLMGFNWNHAASAYLTFLAAWLYLLWVRRQIPAIHRFAEG